MKGNQKPRTGTVYIAQCVFMYLLIIKTLTYLNIQLNNETPV